MQTIIEEYTPTNLEGLTGRCNQTLHNCKHPMCDYHYPSPDEIECPECGTLREKCSQYPTKGRDRCRYHGGHTPTGIASANHQGKGLSKSVPTRFLDKYAMHYKDPDILSGNDDIALLKMRRDTLLEALDENVVSPKQWEILAEKYEGLSRAIDLGHANKTTEMLWALGQEINKGHNAVMLWREINSTIEQSRKVKDSEIRRIKTAQTIITEQQFQRTIGFIISVIRNRVKDQDLVTAIMRDFESLNV